MTRDTIGKWILPQPKEAKDTGEYISIPRLTKLQVPFGYKVSEHDEMMLDPIPFELESLEQAKDYLKRYGSRHVAAWLTKTTGRYISHAGLLKRVKDEQRYTSKVATLRKWAARYRKAVEEAEKYENRRGTKIARQAREIIDSVDATRSS
jgi:hypothetical protein